MINHEQRLIYDKVVEYVARLFRSTIQGQARQYVLLRNFYF
jgi:hypothetical protein